MGESYESLYWNIDNVFKMNDIDRKSEVSTFFIG